jgi:hypothetical protein
MQSQVLFSKARKASSVSALFSLACASCTLMTDLDFVGERPIRAGETRDASAEGKDAAANGVEPKDGSVPPQATSSTATNPTSSDGESRSLDAAAPDPADAADADTSPAMNGSAPDAVARDASPDSALSDAGTDCVSVASVLFESYEGDLTRWSAVNWQDTDCQQTYVATDLAVDKEHAVRSRIECASESDHLHFTALRLQALTATPATGIAAPYGVLLSFSVWLSVGYDFDADRWLQFVRFRGACDLTDEPQQVGLNDAERYLSVSNARTERRADTAPRFPLASWAKVTIYINYAAGSFAVWQDNLLVNEGTFEREASNLCYLEFGTMAAQSNSDLVTFQDDLHLALLDAPIGDLAASPTPCSL